MALVRGTVLDVGCGDKSYHRLFPSLKWTGLDIRPVGDIEADMHKIPSDDESFDTVLCLDTLQFSLQPAQAIAEMWRVLKPGGHLIIAAPNTAPEEQGGLINYKVIGLVKLVEAVTGTRASGAAGRGLIATDAGMLRKRSKFTGGWSAEMQGWVDDADSRFPVVSIVVAQKE